MDEFEAIGHRYFFEANKRIRWKDALKHASLFLLTLVTATFAGIFWKNQVNFSEAVDTLDIFRILFTHFSDGLEYSFALLFILSCHEFGHYFAARYHKVSATLPYYIPFPPIPGLLSFGTFGAVIRIRQTARTRKALFDIGIAGPIAGYFASILVLIWGFTHLPGKEFILSIHPDFNFALGSSPNVDPANMLEFGSTIMYSLLGKIFSPSGVYVPDMSEMYHYPFLITGWFGLLVTALNLLPASQLDGGHILYATVGEKHRNISLWTVRILLIVGAAGLISELSAYLPASFATLFPHSYQLFISRWCWSGWLVWGGIIRFILKIDHPPIEDEAGLDDRRKLLSYFALLMFISSITPVPILLGEGF